MEFTKVLVTMSNSSDILNYLVGNFLPVLEGGGVVPIEQDGRPTVKAYLPIKLHLPQSSTPPKLSLPRQVQLDPIEVLAQK